MVHPNPFWLRLFLLKLSGVWPKSKLAQHGAKGRALLPGLGRRLLLGRRGWSSLEDVHRSH